MGICRFLKAASLAFLIFTIFSCDVGNSTISDTTITKNNEITDDEVPYASDSEIEISNDYEDIVDYKLVRNLLKIDYEAGLKGTYDWEGAEISEKPVIIYDSKCKPEYYEFKVKTDSGAIGTITTYATKASTDVVSYVIPWVRDYTTYLTKAGEYSLFSEGYPTRIVCGVLGKAGDTPSVVVDIDTGETVDLPEQSDKELFLKEMQSYTEEELEEMGLENWEEEYQEVTEEIDEETDDAAEFWEAVETYEDNFLALTDEKIEETYNETKWSDSNYYNTYDTYILSKYSSSRMQKTFWRGWCFPSAMCWFYRGLYSTYDDTYLPLDGDSSFGYSPYRYANAASGSSYYYMNSTSDSDNDGVVNRCDEYWIKAQSTKADGGLYYYITTQTNFYDLGTGGVSGSYCNSVVKKLTSNKYKTSATLLHNSVHKNIRNNCLPVFITETTTDGGHIMNGLGSRYKVLHWTRKYKLIWWSWTSSKSKTTNKDWLIHDNGYETKDNDYEPFWSNDNNYNWKWHYKVISN